jgi:hypothetical protein
MRRTVVAVEKMPPLRRSTNSKMPAHYIAQANREKLGFSGMEKVVAFDQSASLNDFAANEARTNAGNGEVTFSGNIRKKAERFQG